MLAKKIRALRKQSKISQEKLAEAIAVSRQTVSKWETSRGEPGVDSLIQLAAFFNITVDELLDYQAASQNYNSERSAQNTIRR